MNSAATEARSNIKLKSFGRILKSQMSYKKWWGQHSSQTGHLFREQQDNAKDEVHTSGPPHQLARKTHLFVPNSVRLKWKAETITSATNEWTASVCTVLPEKFSRTSFWLEGVQIIAPTSAETTTGLSAEFWKGETRVLMHLFQEL